MSDKFEDWFMDAFYSMSPGLTDQKTELRSTQMYSDMKYAWNACAEKAVDRDRLKECELALREFLIDSEWSLELTTERERMVIEYFKKYGELK